MHVRVGSILHAYTGGRDEVEAEGATLGELFDDLERRYPGLRFRVVDEQERVRPHVSVFLDARAERELSASLADVDCVHVLGALSGG